MWLSIYRSFSTQLTSHDYSTQPSNFCYSLSMYVCILLFLHHSCWFSFKYLSPACMLLPASHNFEVVIAQPYIWWFVITVRNEVSIVCGYLHLLWYLCMYAPFVFCKINVLRSLLPREASFSLCFVTVHIYIYGYWVVMSEVSSIVVTPVIVIH